MRAVKKHNFEAVSLLTVKEGVLDVTIIPASHQPKWMVPTELILDTVAYDEHIWTYLWHAQAQAQAQEVSVYHLSLRHEAVDTLVILEGNTDAHRLALQTKGTLEHRQVRISDVKDAQLPRGQRVQMMAELPNLLGGSDERKLDYIFQTVNVDNELYIVPDIDLIAHCLVDLDS